MLSVLVIIYGIAALASTIPTDPKAFNASPLWRGQVSFDNLTSAQRLCLMQAFNVDHCKVMDAIIFCGEIDGGWHCLTQLPEIGACSQVTTWPKR